MSVSSSDLLGPAASTTSSGFADGLGRRVLAFDREEGAMLERLTVRPELAAFEAMLRDRVERVAALEDERIARPRTIERDADGSLVIIAEFVPGSRLSDLLDTAAEEGASPGVDAAFGFLLDVLPALCGLHAGAGFAHGTITPSRIVLTPAGQIVLLDTIYGGALSHLRYSRRRLWTEFGVATPAATRAPRLDVEADIAQTVLAAVMLVLGRPLYVDEYPGALPRLIREVIEIAQIRGTSAFAEGVQAFLERALPLPNRRPYATADDALIAVRDLASELGLHVCRRALVDFIEQMEPSGTATAGEHAPQRGITDGAYAAAITTVDEDLELDADEPEVVEAELDLEELVEEPLYDLGAVPEKPAAFDRASFEEAIDAPVVHAEPPRPVVVVSEIPAAPPLAPVVVPPALVAAPPALPATLPPLPPAPVLPPVDVQAEAGAAQEDEDEEPAASGVRSKRAKRSKSARARKDKLRSAAAPAPLATQKAAPTPKPKPEPEPEPEPEPAAEPAPAPKKPSAGNWLVAPGQAAAFEPAVPDEPVRPAPVAPPAPAIAPMMPPPPVPQYAPFTPPAMAAPPVPQYPPVMSAPPPPAFAPPSWSPPAQQSAPMTPAPIAPAGAPLRLKQPAIKPRAIRPSPPAVDIYAEALPPVARDQPSAFPWKLAAAALAVMTLVIVGGRAYLPSNGASASGDDPAPVASAAAKPDTSPSAKTAPVASVDTGRLEIETQPAGARILIDGKPSGETPIALDAVPVGRHTVTLTSPAGSVKRTVRIEAGRTAKLDVPIFSGWVGVFAPFVVEVSEGGKVIGTTEESRLMLSPGRHDLLLTNRELGYRSVQSVEIEPGEVRSISLDPRGTVNVNATPWAEVWIDGQKAGDTPLANLQLPLGVREVILRHPQFGERRVTVTVKGNEPAAVSVAMDK